MRVGENVEISRPVEEVFTYVSDPQTLPEWSGIVKEVRSEAQGTLREGDRYTSVAKFLQRFAVQLDHNTIGMTTLAPKSSRQGA